MLPSSRTRSAPGSTGYWGRVHFLRAPRRARRGQAASSSRFTVSGLKAGVQTAQYSASSVSDGLR